LSDSWLVGASCVSCTSIRGEPNHVPRRPASTVTSDTLTRDIITAVNSLLVADDEQLDNKSGIPGGMSLAEKMALWADKEKIAQPKRDDLFDGVDGDKDDKFDVPELLSYRNILAGSLPYEWLMATLRRELQGSGANSPDLEIRNQILEMLPSGEISRHRPPRAYDITFELSWDILARGGLGRKFSDTEMMSVDESGFESYMTVLRYVQDRWPSIGTRLVFLLDDLTQSQVFLSRSSFSISPASKYNALTG